MNFILTGFLKVCYTVLFSSNTDSPEHHDNGSVYIQFTTENELEVKQLTNSLAFRSFQGL